MVPKSRRMDVGRLASLVARPGIDTRTWITYATVRDVCYDPDHGVLADVTFIPSDIQETVLVGTAYAGDGFGSWCPLEINDMVLVAIPEGDSSSGAVIIARLWSAIDKPPALAAGTGGNPSGDPSIRVAPGRKLLVQTHEGSIEVTAENGAIKITATEGANIELKVTNGKITLGGDGLTPLLDGVVTARGVDPFTGATYGALGNASSVVLARKT